MTSTARTWWRWTGPAAPVTDMTGSTLAAILIPPAGTIFLVAWLALVFYAGRDHPRGQAAARCPAARAPARPRRPAGARQTPAHRIGGRSSGHEPAGTPDQRHNPVHDPTGKSSETAGGAGWARTGCQLQNVTVDSAACSGNSSDALLRTMVEAVDADEFDVWADSGLAGEAGCKASAAEEQEFRQLIDTATWQQTAQVLKPPELT